MKTRSTAAHHVARRRLETPLGWVSLTRSAQGLSGLWFDGQKHYPRELETVPIDDADPLLGRAATALLEIKPGESDSYGALARKLGRPKAVRAVGAAVGRNPISILIPCHRVLGSDGGLTGYAGGLPRKTKLLKLEGLER